MRLHFTIRDLFWLVLVIALAPRFGMAADYDKIDRTITKEPKYKSGSPKYVLLLFGPNLKRVWLVIDGDTAYLDRNGDGDLTSADDRFDGFMHRDLDVDIADPDGVTKYLIRNLEVYKEEGSPTGQCAMLNVRINGRVKFMQYCDSAIWDTPSKATIAHFNGPLTIGPDIVWFKLAPGEKLHTGDKPAIFLACVGTFDQKYGCWVVVRSMNGEEHEFPTYAPIVDIDFPPKSPGGLPVRKRYLLDDVCCQSNFKTDIVSPPEAGPGTAKVTFSFDMWKEGHVARSTADIPVITAEQAKQEAKDDAAVSNATNQKEKADAK